MVDKSRQDIFELEAVKERMNPKRKLNSIIVYPLYTLDKCHKWT